MIRTGKALVSLAADWLMDFDLVVLLGEAKKLFLKPDLVVFLGYSAALIIVLVTDYLLVVFLTVV